MKNGVCFLLRAMFILLISVSLCSLSATQQVSIYDIQFTMDAGFDGTYPSPYLNQIVIIQGVVTGTHFENGKVFVSHPTGGAWSAICVELPNSSISVGNLIEVQGRVSEQMGMTTLTNTQNLRVIQQSSPLPNPVNVSVYDALTNEAYESVLVRLSNIQCSAKLNGSFLATVDDSTASINIGNGFGANIADYFVVGSSYQYITGVVSFSFSRFSVHPRGNEDIMPISAGSQSTSWGKIKSLYR